MCGDQETFWTLLNNAAHWEFEIFLMVLCDGVILGLLWPYIRKHIRHHDCPSEEEKDYSQKELVNTNVRRSN